MKNFTGRCSCDRSLRLAYSKEFDHLFWSCANCLPRFDYCHDHCLKCGTELEGAYIEGNDTFLENCFQCFPWLERVVSLSEIG